jgi:AraC-like DNA-binding protein
MHHDLTGMARVKEGTVRAAALRHVPEMLSSYGVGIEPLLDEVGLPHSILSEPENTIPVKVAAELVRLCGERTGRPHFALLAGQKMALDALGLVGLLMLHSANVGTAWRSMILTLHLHGRANVPSLSVRDDVAVLSFSQYEGGSDAQQVADFTLAASCSAMRTLCGQRWVATEVLISHRAPSDRRPYSRFFKAPLRFGADRTALVFPSSWLSRRIPGANPETRRAVQQSIAGMLSHQDFDLLTKVRRALFALIVEEHVTIDNLARMLGVHKRTLNRRLAQFDTTFAKMLNEVRFQLAQQLLSDTDLPLVEIATTLNYTDASTFTRAFRSWAGTTPSAWRARLRAWPQPSSSDDG